MIQLSCGLGRDGNFRASQNNDYEKPKHLTKRNTGDPSVLSAVCAHHGAEEPQRNHRGNHRGTLLVIFLLTRFSLMVHFVHATPCPT
jgi:hypothetical protein